MATRLGTRLPTLLRERSGLALEYDHKALYASAMPFKDLPEQARATWANKASDAGAQVDIDDLLLDALDET